MTIDIETSKPVDDIEADIAHTRAEMSETLQALEEKLDPQRLLNKGMDAVRETISWGSSDLGDKLLRNPAPVALFALGIGWFLLSKGRKADAAEPVHQTDFEVTPTEISAAEPPAEPKGPWENIVVRHPMTVGMMGVAAGALAAMLLPRTKLEDEWIGEASDQLRREAQTLAREAVDRAQRAAETAAAEAVNAAVTSVANDLSQPHRS